MVNRVSNTEKFKATYTECLMKAIQKKPEQFAYSPEEQTVKGVVDKMTLALSNGSANMDSSAIRSTCRKLGIKFNIKSIKEFLNG